nr:hypothetical protein [Tanacetum cinerariifolium]
MAYTSSGSSSSSNSDSDVSTCSKACLKSYVTLKEQYDSLSSDYKKSQFNLVSYKASLQSVEERLVHYKKNEAVFAYKINILNLKVRLRDNSIVEYTKKLEKAEKKKDELKQTLEKFQNSSKSLNNLLESQVSDKVKTRLGYKAASPAEEIFVKSSKMLENQKNVKSRSDKGYHAVPPHYTGNYIPPKPDLMYIDKQVKSESVDVVSNVTSSVVKTVESKVKSVDVKIRTTQAKEIADLKKRAKKLERKRRSRTPGMNLFKIGTTRRRSLGKDDASKQGRNLKQRRAEKKTTNQSSKEESNMNLSDLSSHSTRINTAYVQLVLLVYKVDAVFNKVNAAKSRVTSVVRVSTAGWIKWLEDQDILRDNAIVEYTKKLKKAEKERDELKRILEKFQNSSKSLNNLLKSQVNDKENVKSTSDKGYHAVSLPYTGNSIPPKPDLMFIDEQVKKSKLVKKNIFSPPIIEDWNSDDESKVEVEHNVEVKTVRPCIKKIKFVKTARKKVEKYDCDKMVVRPVWNNSRMVNHKNFANKLTHPYLKRKFAPQAVLMRSGYVLLNTRQTVNSAKPVSNVINRAHSTVRRPFNQRTTFKNRNMNKKVNAVTRNSVNTVVRNEVYAVKAFGLGKDRLKLKELMELSTKLSDRVFDLEKIKTTQAKEIVDLKKRVKKLERKRRYRTLRMNLFKIGTSKKRSLGKDDASKQGRNLIQSGSDHKDANEHIEKVLEIVDLFHGPNITQDQTKFLGKYCPPARTAKKIEEINNFQQEPNETIYQAWERFKELLMKFPQNYLTEMQEVILFYNGLDVSARQIIDSKAIQAQLNNLGREIKKVNIKVYTTQVECEQCKRPHYTKDCPLKEEGKTLEEAYYTQFGLGELAYTKLTVELVDRTMKHPKGIVKDVLVRVGKFIFLTDFMILDMPEDVKVPLILRRPFLSTARAKIDVFKRKITLRVGDEKIIFKSVKPASSLIKRVYMLSLRERMKLDLEARLMEETLVLNISLDPLYGDYIELNDLNVPLELRREQVDDLMPTIEEGEVINTRNNESTNVINTRRDQVDDLMPMIDIINARNNESFDEYPSFCDFDRKIHIDCAYNLSFSCMIVVKNIDGYRDQDIGDVIFGEPFCKALCVEARRFDGLITIHNGNDNVTYQMARSHPRFKHLSNAQCNKIRPLLKELAEKEIDNVGERKPRKGQNRIKTEQNRKRGEAGKSYSG